MLEASLEADSPAFITLAATALWNNVVWQWMKEEQSGTNLLYNATALQAFLVIEYTSKYIHYRQKNYYEA